MDPHTHGIGMGMGIGFPLWGSTYGYPYGDIHGIPKEILWEWDGNGNGNSLPTATLNIMPSGVPIF